MTTVRRQIAESLSDKPYRHALVDQNLSRWTAVQLRQIREDQEMTQAMLASLVGMQQSSISDLEKPGKRQPTIDTLTRIAEGLDVALLVEYVPFSRFVNHMASVPHEVLGISQEAMSVRRYDDDTLLQKYLLERESPTASTVASLVRTTTTTSYLAAEQTLEEYARSLNEAFEAVTPAEPHVVQAGGEFDKAA